MCHCQQEYVLTLILCLIAVLYHISFFLRRSLTLVKISTSNLVSSIKNDVDQTIEMLLCCTGLCFP